MVFDPTRSGTSLEAVDVDQAAVRDLQVRDHRQPEERQRQEGRRAGPAEGPRGVVAGETPRDDLLEGRICEEACDRERELRADRAVLDGHDPAPELGQPGHGEGHVVVGRADDHDVVRVVSNGRGERAPGQSDPCTKPSPILPVPR